MKRAIDLILDSGAYSAWTRGVVIDVAEYASWLRSLERYFAAYVNLDVIPGRKSQGAPSLADIEESAKLSRKNLEFLKRRGLEPMPVFHQGESFDWLQRMIDDREPYIGISTREGFGNHREWLDYCFAMMTNDEGYPLMQTHAFGMTDFELIARYPWYSVDSTTWIRIATQGCILIPTLPYPRRLHLGHSPDRLSYIGLGPQERLLVDAFLAGAQCSIEKAKEEAFERERITAAALLAWAAKKKRHAFSNPGGSMIPMGKHRTWAGGGGKGIRIDHLRYIFAGSMGARRAALLLEAGARDRLSSFLELRRKPLEAIAAYVKSGKAL